MRRRHRSFQRSLLCFIATVLGILLAVMLSITFYVHDLLDRVQYSDVQSILSDNADPDLYSLGDQQASADPGRIGGKGSGLINILLIGQDRWSGDATARSDSMILCTFNTRDNAITMTSFLRDLYVPIPGHPDNRLNAAYALGGMELLCRTLDDNFGICIDGCIEVDFTQFSQIVDLLGGVSMELRQDEADAINAAVPGDLTAGEQWLSGRQALAYSRIRNLDADGDFSRTNRQRKLISALVSSYRDADLGAVLSLIPQALPLLSTDMSKAQLLRYCVELFPLLAGTQIASQQIPAPGSYTDQTVNGMAVLIADMDAARQLLTDTLPASPKIP